MILSIKHIFSNKIVHALLVLWLPIFMLGSLPIFSSWLENRYQVAVQDLAIPLMIDILFTSIICAIFWKKYHTHCLAAYIGAILSVLIIGESYDTRFEIVYKTLHALNPFLTFTKNYEPVLLSIVFISIIMIGTYYIGKLFELVVTTRKLKKKEIIFFITIVISVAFAIQFLTTVKVIIAEWQQFFYQPPAINSKTSAKNTLTDKPDIYYIVLDRYTNQNVLESQFGFDNSNFTQYLKNSGFYVNPNAHSNYPYTTMSIASTMNANYHTDLVEKFSKAADQTVEPFHDSIRESSVVQKLKSFGYKYLLLGSWYETSNSSPLADENLQRETNLIVLGHTFYLNDYVVDYLTQSIFWSLVKHGIHIGNFPILSYGGQSEADATLYKLDTLNKLAADKPGGRFIFAHLLIPHDPYYFNADGSLNTNSGNDSIGEPIKQKYVGQVQFINNQIKSVIEKINQNSNGQAIIILQSDEGPYPMQLIDQNFNSSSVGEELSTGNMLGWSDQSLKMKYGTLSAYHVPKASDEELSKAGDSVNIFRLVLNNYFGGDLPYLPECYYAYTNGRDQSFVFSDITKRLTGQDNPACPKNSEFGANP